MKILYRVSGCGLVDIQTSIQTDNRFTITPDDNAGRRNQHPRKVTGLHGWFI